VGKAKSLLAEAGHPDGIDVELVSVGGIAGLEQFAELYAQMAQAAAVRVTLRKVPFDVFIAKDFTKVPLADGQ
jgi:peptide/nickel transport system substrate-binding protein